MSNLGAGSFGRSVVCPVLVGREAEVAALRRLIDDAGAARSRVALVAGEAGVGKSRLVAEARAHAAEQGWLVLEAACFPQDRGCPYAPLLDLLRARLASQSAEARFSAVGPFAGELFSLLPDLVPQPPGRSWTMGIETEKERRRLFAALAHCLLAEADVRPTLLVVEDLHWCDEASLDFLLYLARQPNSQPRLLLATYRAEDAEPSLDRWLAQLDRERLAEELVLNPLDRDAVGEMLAITLGLRRPIPAELLDSIQSLAEGNPFYAEELLEALIASGDIRHSDGVWDWEARPAADWRLPRSLHAAVRQRVAQLGPSTREVLTLAAVVGRRFDFELLLALTRLDERALLDVIKELITAQLVVEESREHFAFRHALIRQAVYTDLLARERVALHRVVAETAEQACRDSADERCGDLAYHFFEAETWDRALQYARRAGERARRLYAPRAAVEQFSRALEAARRLVRSAGSQAPISAANLAALHRERGRAAETLGDFEQALADYGTAAELARVAGDPRAEWQALLDLGLLWSGRDYGTAGSYFGQALELARALEEPALVAQSLNRSGNWRVNAAHPREALPLHREALAIFESLGDRAGIAATLDLLGMASYISADLQGSMRYYERAVSLFRQLDDREGLSSALAMLASRAGCLEVDTMSTEDGSLEESLRLARQALELARAIDWRSGEVFALLQVSMVLAFQGSYEPGLEEARRALRLAEEIEHRQWITAAHVGLAHIYLDMLDLPAAVRHLERALSLAREIHSAVWQQQVSGLLSWAYTQQRELGRAAALVGDAAPSGPVESLGQWWIVFAQAQLALAQRQFAEALRLLEFLRAPLSDGGAPRDTLRLGLARGRVLTALGRAEEAEAVLQQVRAVARQQHLRPQLWRSQAALGELYRKQHRQQDAQREFSAARAVIEDLAAEIQSEALRDNLLRTTTASLPRPYRLSERRSAAARHGGLTTREREVAVLLARGRSNREIAATLVLGERTVETHVSNLLAKLGLASRREVAGWAADQGLSDNLR